jgi:hypothetical protein
MDFFYKRHKLKKNGHEIWYMEYVKSVQGKFANDTF